MNTACNIDQRGRKARLITGLIVDLCGVGLIVAAALGGSTPLLVAGILASVSGLFIIFEGLRGWCVLRAFGFKTKI